MKIVKVGKYIFLRHWCKWYTVHQINPDDNVYLEHVKFPLNSTDE